MKVLVACEFSGIVRDAFIERGHDAVSYDLIESERPGPHIVSDIRSLDLSRYDLLIAHPPCTYLCNSGVRWLYENGRGAKIDAARWALLERDAAFFRWCLDAPVARVAVENPTMHGYALDIVGAVHSQSVQPWQFGHGETKETRLWLRGLPLLVPTDIVDGRAPRVHHASPGPERWKERSRTLPGLVAAMATQWGAL